jgi:hypothetical protein
MIVTTSLSRRGFARAGGGLLLTGILPIDDNVSDWRRGLQGRGADRFERAEEFYRGIAAGLYRDPRDLLYQAGIVAQLGIGAYLLELGASDDWCRQRIGLFVDKALAIANEAGLNHRQPDMLELARLLSPYGQWRGPLAADMPMTAAIDRLRVSATLNDLLGTVRGRLAGDRIEARAR